VYARTKVTVPDALVAVGGTGVFVGGTGVLVGTGVFIGTSVLVGVFAGGAITVKVMFAVIPPASVIG
jgi:hypothetical protein